jgi:hypothetical protein
LPAAGNWGCEVSVPTTNYVQTVGTNAIGAVEVTVRTANLPVVNGSVILKPTLDANGQVTGWLCGPKPVSISKYLPGSCRDQTVNSEAGFATN